MDAKLTILKAMADGGWSVRKLAKVSGLVRPTVSRAINLAKPVTGTTAQDLVRLLFPGDEQKQAAIIAAMTTTRKEEQAR